MLGVALLGLMALFGYGVYRGLGHFKHTGTGAGGIAEAPALPEGVVAGVNLPGTIYLSQKGDLYALRGAHFSRVLSHDQRGAWGEPAATPDGRLVVVARGDASADLYVLDPDGRVSGQLTNDAAGKRPSDGSLEFNHFAFHPRVSRDGSRVLFDFDSPKCGFLYSLAVWSMPMPATAASLEAPPAPAITSGCAGERGAPPGGRRQTTPVTYTPGDTQPIPLDGGGLLFVRYVFDDKLDVHSELYYQRSSGSQGVALTDPAQDCSQPDLSPDQASVAMVCSAGQPTATLSVASLTLPPAGGSGAPTLGPPRALLGGCLCAFPTWSPDGSAIAYLAPLEGGGNFQLWVIEKATGAAAARPRQVTERLGLDATSRPAWVAR